MGKVVPKAPVRTEKAFNLVINTKWGGSNRIELGRFSMQREKSSLINVL